jgi:hypothetical protein
MQNLTIYVISNCWKFCYGIQYNIFEFHEEHTHFSIAQLKIMLSKLSPLNHASSHFSVTLIKIIIVKSREISFLCYAIKIIIVKSREFSFHR